MSIDASFCRGRLARTQVAEVEVEGRAVVSQEEVVSDREIPQVSH